MAMESRAKAFGHAIHPMLIVFPLGLFITAVAFDIAWLTTHRAPLAAAAYWDIVAGILGGLTAAVFGLVDWLAIPAGTRARAIGMWHGLGNVVVVGCFAASAWLRHITPGYRPSMTAFSLGLLAIVLGAVTAWMGGELVERMGVGVDPGAHLDAPSSLAVGHLTADGEAPAVTNRRAAGMP